MSQELVTLTPEQEAYQAEQEALKVLTSAKTVVVADDDGYREAGQHFATIKGMIKTLEARRVAITGPINQSLKLINEGFKRPKETLEQALAFYERPMVAFQRSLEAARIEAEAIARKERERLEAEAKAAARAEEDKLIAARLAAQEAQKAAEAAAVALILAEQAAQDAQDAAQEARANAEEAIRNTMRVEVPEVFIPKSTAAGSRVNRPWCYRIVNEALIPDEFWMLDEKKIAAHVKQYKEDGAVPGIEVFQDLKIGGA